MRTVTALAAMATSIIAIPTAGADQCAWIEPAAADRATELLQQTSRVIQFCEPCGDKAPGLPYSMDEAFSRNVDGGHSEVVVNGDGIDLAYTYVLRGAGGEYRNLADLAGCPADGVSAALTVQDATDTGVLIAPDPAADRLAEPIAPVGQQFAEPPWAIPAATFAEPPPEQPPIVYIYQVGIPPWVLVLCLTSTLMIMAAAFTLLSRARRSSLLPRAIALGERKRAPIDPNKS